MERVRLPCNLTSEIRELDERFFGDDDAPTWRSFAQHARLVCEAELAYPIIRAADGAVMDGMHRVAKALSLGRHAVDAVQFATDPAPDYVGCRPDELPYRRAAGRTLKPTGDLPYCGSSAAALT